MNNKKRVGNRISEQRSVEIKVLAHEFSVYSNPIILMANLKGGKRSEAAQWSLEIQKMLRGIIESLRLLEGVMNQAEQNKKIVIDGEEIVMPDEDMYWLMTYLVDNAILRIYACLDKVAQMVRCYFEHKENGGPLEVISKCGCKDLMTENNCTFGSLINYLRVDKKRSPEIVKALHDLNSNNSIQDCRVYRNAFIHRRHELDRTMGLDPKIKATYSEDGTVSTMFSFGGALPSINWFRVAIAGANNAIAECVERIGYTIFPRDFNIHLKKVDEQKKP